MFIFSDAAFKEAVEKFDVTFRVGVGDEGLVVAGAPEGGHGLVEWWKGGVEAYLAGKSLL